MKTADVQPGSHIAPKQYQIKIVEQGPYLVFGHPPLKQYFLTSNKNGEIWTFKEGESYQTDEEPTALCRCGRSKNKPYCDGSHTTATDWDSALTAPEEALLLEAETIQGPQVTLTDNQHYCVFARFCDAKGRVWNIVENGDSDEEARTATYEANHCPGGRLSTWDNTTGRPNEPVYEPSLGLIEDPAIRVSSGLWVRGGIPVVREDGYVYEIRNRVMLCRCGESSNKPFCDGTHASMHFRDGLPDKPKKDGKEF